MTYLNTLPADALVEVHSGFDFCMSIDYVTVEEALAGATSFNIGQWHPDVSYLCKFAGHELDLVVDIHGGSVTGFVIKEEAYSDSLYGYTTEPCCRDDGLRMMFIIVSRFSAEGYASDYWRVQSSLGYHNTFEDALDVIAEEHEALNGASTNYEFRIRTHYRR